jgi:glutathione S-transferase
MIKLYGAPLSNYYNMVKTGLLEKGIEFEAIMAPPSQEDDYLAKSAMGKIPCIETDEGFLAESMAILDYLEEAHPEPALLPSAAFARAKVRELAQSLELYLELVARRGYGALQGKAVAEDVREGIRTDLTRGVGAIKRLAAFSPWIAGESFTYADLIGYFTFTYGNLSAKANAELDLFAEIPGSQAWYDKVGARDSVKQAEADLAATRRR